MWRSQRRSPGKGASTALDKLRRNLCVIAVCLPTSMVTKPRVDSGAAVDSDAVSARGNQTFRRHSMAAAAPESARAKISTEAGVAARVNQRLARARLRDAREVVRGGYFKELLIEVNMPLRLLPRPLTTAMMARAMPAAINPYSIAVAPESSDTNFKTMRFNVASVKR
jgi:hypothetical protein